MNQFPLKRTSWFEDLMIWILQYFSKFLFESVHFYFPAKKQEIPCPSPFVALANHIEERDVPLLPTLHKFMEIRSKYTIPVRRDILEKNFLLKEFKPKGITKYLFWLIDKTWIVPLYLKYIGGYPVARPFRDDARHKAKAGTLRDTVEEQWEYLSERIRAGRKLFLFPEGTYSADGYLNQIRKGLFFLHKKIASINYLNITLTYDYISAKKGIAHVGLSEVFQMPEDVTEKEFTCLIREKLSEHYTITPGNLFSYSLFSEDVKKGIPRHFLFFKMERLVNTLYKSGNYYIAKELLVRSYDDIFAEILFHAKETGYLESDNSRKFSGTKKLYEAIESKENQHIKKLRKKNIYLYHRNQLRGIQSELDKIWSEIEVFD